MEDRVATWRLDSELAQAIVATHRLNDDLSVVVGRVLFDMHVGGIERLRWIGWRGVCDGHRE
jgi:hypothetical protein